MHESRHILHRVSMLTNCSLVPCSRLVSSLFNSRSSVCSAEKIYLNRKIQRKVKGQMEKVGIKKKD